MGMQIKWVFTLLLHLSLIILQVTFSWKMELCIHGSNLTVHEDECNVGIWFSQPWEISAACFDGGIWAVYESWCQERPRIWTVYPDRHGCMKKSHLKKVIGIVYLGEDTSGAAISTMKHKLFLGTEHSQKKNGSLTKWKLKEDEDLEVLVWGNSLHAAHVSSPDGDHYRCLMKGRHSYSASYSFPPPYKTNLSLELKEGPCNTSTTHRWNSAQLYPTQNSPTKIFISSIEDNKDFHCVLKRQPHNDTIRSKNFKRNIETVNFMAYSRTKDLLVNPIHEDQINEQTERLARKLIAHAFLDEPIPDLNFIEWKFLLMAEEIFDIACPQEMVPREFFENMLIFYRLLLLESFDKFPPRIEDDQDTRNRIEESLKNCLKEAKPLVFENMDQCSTGLEAVKTEYEHVNGTKEFLLAQLPEKINLRRFDVLLESTWKLMLFIHYYCADFFKNSPADLSILQQRWQDLMAPDLITRWQCPGKSYQMARTLLRMVNLPKTLRHLDHCVAAAHISSVYLGWIQRPKPLQPQIEGKPNHDPYGSDQSMFPLKQDGEDFDLYNSPMGSHFPEVQWDKKTNCLQEYDDPMKLLALKFDSCGAERSS